MELKGIYHYLTDLILILDEEGKIIDLNSSAQSYFSDPEIINKDFFVLSGQDDVIDWQTIQDSKNLVAIGQKKSALTAEVYLSSLLTAEFKGLNIYWFDLEQKLLLCNIAQARVLGKNHPKEVQGKTLAEIVSIWDQEVGAAECLYEKIVKNNQEIIESRQPIVFEEQLSDEGEHIFLSYKAPFYDDQGNVQGIFGISNEISTLKTLQKQLEKSRHAADYYLESILMSSPSNIYWLDEEGRAIGCNDHQAKCVGLNSRDDIIGTTVFDLAERLGWPQGMAGKIRQHDLMIMNNRRPITYREKVLLNGHEKIFLAFKSPMLDQQGKVIGILGISTDITAQAQAEQELERARQQAEAANRYKTEFITNISHDIRTPLSGIHGIANWLLEKVPAEFQAEVSALIKSSNELLHLLNNVIHISKLELDGSPKHTPVAVNLRELIHRVVDLMEVVARQKKISLSVNYPDNVPSYFMSLSYLLQQVILNLVSNALKFTEQGAVTIDVAKDPKILITDGKFFPLLLTVSDTGIGISEQYYDEIFESFRRLKNSYEDPYYGSGLGLSIVRQSVEKLGGRVSVKSEVGKGSWFFVNLPLMISQAPTQAITIDEHWKDKISLLENINSKPLEIQQNLVSTTHQLKILLVEDNVLIQKGIVFILNKLNCNVEIASTARHAIELAERNQYDLVFMDIGLPDRDGFWAVKHIRQNFAHYTKTPIIALTAHLDQEYRATCEEAGMNDIITKPLTLELARDCLQSYGLTD